MRHSTERILVSHAGNLPRPGSLDVLVDGGTRLDAATGTAYRERLPRAVQEIVDVQIGLGVDIVNDGEYAKAGSYGGYMQQRVTGYAILPADASRPPKRAGTAERDRRAFPGFYQSGLWFAGSGGPVRPGFATPGDVRQTTHRACIGPVTYTGQAMIQADIANLQAAIAGKDVEGYIAALGPISLGAGAHNDYYNSE